MGTPYHRLNAFYASERGGVTILFGLSCVALLLVMGVAIDSARYQDLSSRTMAALDGASLAAAKMLDDENVPTEEVQARARAYFEAAVPTFGVDVSWISELTVNVDRTENSVESLVQIKVPSFFGPLAGLGPMTTVNRAAKVIHNMGKLEVALVLDVTGSMNDKNKIGDMKAAAADIIDELMDNAVGETSVRIAVAPYSASVNAGSLASTVSSVPNTTTCTTNWFGWQTCKTSAGVDQDTCVVERIGANASTDAPPTSASDKLRNITVAENARYSCPNAVVVPLQGKSNKDMIKTTIAGYVAGGGTAGHIGTAWGWYLLSPNWSSVLPADSAPRSYSDTHVKKIMIVMTDGAFNTAHMSASTSSPNPPDAQQITESYAQFQNICNGAKGENIDVYTIGYDLVDPAALSNLQDCASAPGNFYDTDAGKLKEAFRDIVRKLNSLRVAS